MSLVPTLEQLCFRQDLQNLPKERFFEKLQSVVNEFQRRLEQVLIDMNKHLCDSFTGTTIKTYSIEFTNSYGIAIHFEFANVSTNEITIDLYDHDSDSIDFGTFYISHTFFDKDKQKVQRKTYIVSDTSEFRQLLINFDINTSLIDKIVTYVTYLLTNCPQRERYDMAAKFEKILAFDTFDYSIDKK